MGSSRIIFSGILLLGCVRIAAQAVDNTASFRIMNANAYVRLNYDNDFFSASDYYYSQGINVEWVSPAFSTFFLNKILVHTRAGEGQTGLSIEHNGYTPTT